MTKRVKESFFDISDRVILSQFNLHPGQVVVRLCPWIRRHCMMITGISAWWFRTSSKFSRQELEGIWKIGSLEYPKLGRISPIMK